MKKILLIEDNAMIRENTAELLELAGYTVIMANDGSDGISVAQKEKYDIILCDVMMPGASGHEVFDALKSLGITDHTPFVFVSASVERKDVEAALAMGADDYVKKPFEETELLDVIQRLTS